MADYAILDANNIITEVIAGNDAVVLIEGIDAETWYGNYRAQVCKRTSSSIRGVSAGIGYSYNSAEDIFITPQPFPSWVRTGSFWDAPTPMPEDGKMYSWDEEEGNWIEIQSEIA